MSIVQRRGVRIAVVVLLLAALVVALGSHRGMAQYGVGYGFDEVAVGETVYAAVGHAETELTVRRVWVDTVGPVAVTPVRCPDERLGSFRSCPGGPLPVFGVQLDPGPEPVDVDGAAIIVLAVTRTGPGPAAVCGVRILHTSGMRAGLTAQDVEIDLAAVGEELPAASELGIAEQRCT